MHRAFRVEDVTSEIVSHLTLNELTGILTTCKALYEPISTAIRRRQYSLTALVELLPKDLVVQEAFDDLRVWDATTEQTLYTDSQTALLHSAHRICGIPLRTLVEGEEDLQEDNPSEDENINETDDLEEDPEDLKGSQRVLVRLSYVSLVTWILT